MSLIHDALKKAQEQEKAKTGLGTSQFQDVGASEKPKLPMRTVVLLVVTILALGFFVYLKFFSSSAPKPKVSDSPATAVAPAITGMSDVEQLKSGASEAYKTNDFDAAWATLQSAKALSPGDPEIWNNIGLVARKRGDVADSRDAYQKALELKPDYPEALNNLAVLDMQSGNNDIAKGLLDKAIRVNPSYPEANFHLGLLYDEQGDKTKALEYYKRFLDVAQNYPSNVVDSVRDRVVELE